MPDKTGIDDPDPALRAFAKLTDEERDAIVNAILDDQCELMYELDKPDEAKATRIALDAYNTKHE